MNARERTTAQKTVWMYGDDGRFVNLNDIAGKPLMARYHGHEVSNWVTRIYLTMLPPLQRD